MTKDRDISVGDLVKGTSMHNHGLIGLVVAFEPNRQEEYSVRWLVGQNYTPEGYYEFTERWYDFKKIS